MTHWIPLSDEWRSIDRSCRATLTIVVSSTDMIAPRITTIATRLTCGSIRGAAASLAPTRLTTDEGLGEEVDEFIP